MSSATTRSDDNASPVSSVSFAPGRAYWNHRLALVECRNRILALSRAVDRPSDLSLYQFAQLIAAVLEFEPDLILELGRGLGNSLCAFAEAASQLPSPCRVLSLCNTADWQTLIVPRVERVVPPSWFRPIEALQCDILSFDYAKALAGAKRILIFWDAHGFDIAECVLGRILPVVADREHLVFMHDMSDARYLAPDSNEYGDRELWKGINAERSRVRLGIVDSAIAQAISIQDFVGRNRLTLDSADHSIDLEINQTGRYDEMRELLGDEIFSLQGHWFWFTLNEHPGPYTFPRVAPPEPRPPLGASKTHPRRRS